MRVLHVVEKYSSGVGSAIAQYTHSAHEAEHFLLSTTAVDAEGDLAEQARFAGTFRMGGSTVAKIRRIRGVVSDLEPHVVHAHSSHGGAFTRLAIVRSRHRIVYTPHCYAFERRDVSRFVRAAFWAAEALLAPNTSVFAACSTRESALSRWPQARARRILVPNIAPVGSRSVVRPEGPPLVVGGGRLSPQKDPEFFALTIESLRHLLPDLRAVWLGDGDAAFRRRLEHAGVRVTGWLPRASVLEGLSAAHLYLHSARWEGFPLMVAEATALGVPTLVRSVPSFADIPDALRLSAADDDAPVVLTCISDPARGEANVELWRSVLSSNTVQHQARALSEAYGLEAG